MLPKFAVGQKVTIDTLQSLPGVVARCEQGSNVMRTLGREKFAVVPNAPKYTVQLDQTRSIECEEAELSRHP